MKLFISKIFLISGIYFIISLIITFVTPYHWGNPWFSTKIQHLEKEKEKGHGYNVFFFGSSRVYRQIDPKLFDEFYIKNFSHEIRSFNLGAPATFNPQSYFLYEKFLNSELSNNAKYCFLELTDVDLINESFLHQERMTYWQNFSDISFVFQSHYNNGSLNREKKIKSICNYSTSYIEGLLHLGHFGQQILNTNYYDDNFVGFEKNGYLNLEDDMEMTKDETVKTHLIERKQAIMDNPELLKEKKAVSASAYENISPSYDVVNLKRILNLIEISEKNGIQLVFILSPRTANSNLIKLSQQIPEANIIDMCNPELYGVLYEGDYSFDAGHLNSKGASLYTELLFEAFKVKLKSNRFELYSWN